MLNAQVSSWRNNPQPRMTTPRFQPSITPRNDVSRWRTQTETIRPGYSIPQQPMVRRWRGTTINPYGYYWGTWGWYQPYPYIWYDDYGWRQRSVIRIYENGKRDTIRKEPTYYTFGLGYTNNKQANFWGTIGGKKNYFILDYVMSYDIDQNQYFPNGRINEVDFPLSKNDFIKQGTFYLGMGKRIGKIGIHGMVGFGNEIIRYQGRDDLGGISFPKSNSNFTTFKFGILKEFKIFTIKFDSDPIRGFTQIGIGINNN